MAILFWGKLTHRGRMVIVPDPHIPYNLDTDRTNALFPTDTESYEMSPPMCNEGDWGLRRRVANAGDGKKRRIWPRNHLALICAQEAAKKLGNNALIRFASRRYRVSQYEHAQSRHKLSDSTGTCFQKFWSFFNHHRGTFYILYWSNVIHL